MFTIEMTEKQFHEYITGLFDHVPKEHREKAKVSIIPEDDYGQLDISLTLSSEMEETEEEIEFRKSEEKRVAEIQYIESLKKLISLGVVIKNV